MALGVGDIKNGITLLIDGEIYQVLDFMHVKPGKGAAFLRMKLINLRSGVINQGSYNTNEKFEQAIIEKKPAQYSYSDAGMYYFMDMETYETYQLTAEQVGDKKNFLKDGCDVSLKFFEQEVLSLDLPEKMEFTITETTGAVAGNTATTATKDATIETGYVLRVPLFIKEGDVIVINTVEGKYDRRAN